MATTIREEVKMSYNEGLNTMTGTLAKEAAISEASAKAISAFRVIELVRDTTGCEINICDNTSQHGSVWIGWANPKVDMDDFIYKGDYEMPLVDAIIKSGAEMLQRKVGRAKA